MHIRTYPYLCIFVRMYANISTRLVSVGIPRLLFIINPNDHFLNLIIFTHERITSLIITHMVNIPQST